MDLTPDEMFDEITRSLWTQFFYDVDMKCNLLQELIQDCNRYDGYKTNLKRIKSVEARVLDLSVLLSKVIELIETETKE